MRDYLELTDSLLWETSFDSLCASCWTDPALSPLITESLMLYIYHDSLNKETWQSHCLEETLKQVSSIPWESIVAWLHPLSQQQMCCLSTGVLEWSMGEGVLSQGMPVEKLLSSLGTSSCCHQLLLTEALGFAAHFPVQQWCDSGLLVSVSHFL